MRAQVNISHTHRRSKTDTLCKWCAVSVRSRARVIETLFVCVVRLSSGFSTLASQPTNTRTQHMWIARNACTVRVHCGFACEADCALRVAGINRACVLLCLHTEFSVWCVRAFLTAGGVHRTHTVRAFAVNHVRHMHIKSRRAHTNTHTNQPTAIRITSEACETIKSCA